MACGRNTMKWKKAMRIAKKNYPNLSLERRRKIAGSIVGGSKKKKRK